MLRTVTMRLLVLFVLSLLTSAATGQTIYVINSPRLGTAAFSPSDLANLKLWLKEDSITASDGDAIQTWSDSSGNSKDAVQTTAGARPIFTNSIAAISGRSALYFDGSDDWYEVTNLTLGSYCTVFLVTQGYGGHPNTFFIEHGPNANSTDGFFFFGDSGDSWRMRRTTSHSATGVADYAGSIWVTATFRYNGSGAFRTNGVALSNGSVTGSDVGDSTTTNSLNIGSRNPSSFGFEKHNLAELIIYDDALSDTDRDNVEAYLRSKYGHY